MNSRTWKQAESEAARIIGGRRVYQKFSAGDAESEVFVADAKKRVSYSQRQIGAIMLGCTATDQCWRLR